MQTYTIAISCPGLSHFGPYLKFRMAHSVCPSSQDLRNAMQGLLSRYSLSHDAFILDVMKSIRAQYPRAIHPYTGCVALVFKHGLWGTVFFNLRRSD